MSLAKAMAETGRGRNSTGTGWRECEVGKQRQQLKTTFKRSFAVKGKRKQHDHRDSSKKVWGVFRKE